MCYIPFIILITDTLFRVHEKVSSLFIATKLFGFQFQFILCLMIHADGFFANLVIYNDLTKQKGTRHCNSLKENTYRKIEREFITTCLVSLKYFTYSLIKNKQKAMENIYGFIHN